jgi:hypothetical protein
MSMIKDASYITRMMFLHLTSSIDAERNVLKTFNRSSLVKKEFFPTYESPDELPVEHLNDVLIEETELR